jgi:hypothetical protein
MKWTLAAGLTLVITATAAPNLRAVHADRRAVPVPGAAIDVPFEPVSGYLAGLLSRFHVPIESQVALFSQTSAQAQLISAENPRVIYFSDDVAIAWVRGSSVIEVVETDPKAGLAFYTVGQDERVAPTLTPAEGCAHCHQTANTLGVPGLLTMSTRERQAEDPEPVSVVTDHRTPLESRWGGWYVTGRSTGWKHRGNRVGQGWLVSLYDQFYDDGYLGAYSDIAALMVLEHQTRMTNLLTLLGTQARNGAPADAVARTVAETVDYMLFVDEAPIPARIISTSGFTGYFSDLGPRDSKGRSLRDFDLKTRLFKYPLSYMVYSQVFQQLPQTSKDAVYDRLLHVLSDSSVDPKHARLTPADRHAILEILTDTQPEFRARAAAGPGTP